MPVVAVEVDVVIVVELVPGVERQRPAHVDPRVIDHPDEVRVGDDGHVDGPVDRQDHRREHHERLEDQELERVHRRRGEHDRGGVAVVPAVDVPEERAPVEEAVAVVEARVDHHVGEERADRDPEHAELERIEVERRPAAATHVPRERAADRGAHQDVEAPEEERVPRHSWREEALGLHLPPRRIPATPHVEEVVHEAAEAPEGHRAHRDRDRDHHEQARECLVHRSRPRAAAPARRPKGTQRTH